ncbi:MAG: hypothetical protein V3U11_14190 [Planctomycetota bacterium]
MRNNIASLVLLAALLAPTPVASQKFITSPAGFLSREGVAFTLLTQGAARRLQTIDGTQVGSARTFRSLALRRDGTSVLNSGPGTVKVTLDMGHGNLGQIFHEMNRNFLGQKGNVIATKTVSFPDWRTKPSTFPAAFNFTNPFDRVFVYNGKDALVWDLRIEDSTKTLRLADAQDYQRLVPRSTPLGIGCVATGQTRSFFHLAQGMNEGSNLTKYGLGLEVTGGNAPPSSPVFLSVNVTDANLTVPGFCSKVRAIPLIHVLLGISDKNGQFGGRQFRGPYVQAAVGTNLVSQLYAPDRGHVAGIALANGFRTVIPLAFARTFLPVASLWSNQNNGKEIGVISFGGAMIARLGY